jgi:hypothetical protein
MHVDRHRGGRGAVGQPLLLFTHLRHGQAEATEIAGHQHVQVASVPELLEIFGKEAVLAVVHCGAFAAGLDQLVAQNAPWCARAPGRCRDWW